MKSYKVIAFLLLFALSITLAMPSPAFAASVSDSSNTSIFTTLVNFLVGDLFTKVLKVDLPGTSAQSPSTPPYPTAPKPDTSGQKEVLGFFAEWWATDTSSYNILKKHSNTIDTIAAFWGTLQSDGSITDRGGNDHAAVVQYATANKVNTLLMVNNSKDHNSAHTVLSSPALREKAITNIEAVIQKYGLAGVNIDFESLDPGDKNNLTIFMQELSSRLKPQGYILSIDVMPKHNEEADFAMAYDYAKLAQFCDQIIIMTYDYHGPWSGPGSIADINSIEKDIRYALQFIPKNKLLLGVAGYGYDWSSKGVESLEFGAIQNLISKFGAKVEWDESAKSPHFTYTGPDGVVHQVWYENAQSLQYKLTLVNSYDLAGIALWKLGEEDPASWQVIQSAFKK